MKYYKISEEELNKLLDDNVLGIPECYEDELDEIVEKMFDSDTLTLIIPGYHGVRDKPITFEKIKEELDSNKLEGAVWHGCPKTHAHTEFTELKFKGTSLISGFCLHCEDELVRLELKKE